MAMNQNFMKLNFAQSPLSESYKTKNNINIKMEFNIAK